MARLADRVAIVTGGAQGIGGATARRLAEDGARVLVADIDAVRAMNNAESIRQSGAMAEALECDVGTEAGVRLMVDRALSMWGRLDIVVNNAYAGLGGRRVDATALGEEEWDRGLNLGLKIPVSFEQRVKGGFRLLNLRLLVRVLVREIHRLQQPSVGESFESTGKLN